MKTFTYFFTTLVLTTFIFSFAIAKEKTIPFSEKLKYHKEHSTKDKKTKEKIGLSFEFKPAYFHPQDSTFRDIYGGGFIALFEINYAFHPHFFFFYENGYFHKKGKIDLGRKRISTSIIEVPLSLGFGCNYLLRPFLDLYAKFAPNYVYTRTKVPPPFLKNKVHEHTGGVTLGVGGKVTFLRYLLIDFFFNYRYDKEKIHDLNSDTRFHAYVGGYEVGVGVGGTF